jgi:arylsulfatase
MEPPRPRVEAEHEFASGFPGISTRDKVVVDVSGDRYVDHEAQVRGWFLID